MESHLVTQGFWYTGCVGQMGMNDFTVLDIETTGLRPEECEITELAAVRVAGLKFEDE